MTLLASPFPEVDKILRGLETFYNTPFLGDTAKNLVDYLGFLEREIATHRMVPYAKAFSVVQSSGTGKSRMLTEVCSGFVWYTML